MAELGPDQTATAGGERQTNDHNCFSNLAIDIVHYIFELILKLNSIHDPSFPFQDLRRCTRQVSAMREVSVGWNNFLLASPRYWCIIDLSSELSVISAALARSKSLPLCVYWSRRPGEQDAMTPARGDQLCHELLKYATRLRTLRSDSSDTHSLCSSLLQRSLPTLRTLDLFWDDGVMASPGHFPEIQYLRIRFAFPSPQLTWLKALKVLILDPIATIEPGVLEVLAQCKGLERLSICSFGLILNEIPSASPPSLLPSIPLPKVKEMELAFPRATWALDFAQILVAPRCVYASLTVLEAFISISSPVTRYCNFLLAGLKYEPNLQTGETPAGIAADYGDDGHLWLRYTTLSRRVNLRLSLSHKSLKESLDAIKSMFQAIQAGLNWPSLTITMVDTSLDSMWILKALAQQNVQNIVIGSYRDSLSALFALAMIERPDGVPTASWPFESLKRITIYDATLSVRDITRLVGRRRRYLQTHTKQWLEAVTLVRCRLVGRLSPTKGIKQLAAIGVTLRALGCIYKKRQKRSWVAAAV
ncbi:hypothetical protein FRB90_006497 [Tulasnella sp. 427]|nr:hypothetical protein FRB90_006497 [Tulasnella sp. 427]